MLPIDSFKFDADRESSLAARITSALTMKTFKVFGFVFLLHCGALAVFLLQSGCRSTQPPSQSRLQSQKLEASSLGNAVSSQVAERTFLGADSSLDSAFNAGLESTRFAPTRPQDTGPVDTDLSSAPTGQAIDSTAVAEIYSVQAGDHLWGLARKFGTTVRELQVLNGLGEDAALQIGQQLRLPTGISSSTALPSVSAPAAQVPASGSSYQVVAGDSLSAIAKRFNTQVDTLKSLNGLTNDRILVGDNLVVPSGDAAAVPATVAPSSPADALIHVVEAGEYPSTIAKRYGLSVQDLLDANGISDPRKLQVGQKLTVGTKPVELPVPTSPPAPVDAPAVNALTAEETLELNALNPASQNPEPVQLNPIQSIAEDLDALVEPTTTNTVENTEALTDEVDELFESAIEIPVIRVE